jgi:hypothetical protein
VTCTIYKSPARAGHPSGAPEGATASGQCAGEDPPVLPERICTEPELYAGVVCYKTGDDDDRNVVASYRLDGHKECEVKCIEYGKECWAWNYSGQESSCDLLGFPCTWTPYPVPLDDFWSGLCVGGGGQDSVDGNDVSSDVESLPAQPVTV